jgi:hypothetical protein
MCRQSDNYAPSKSAAKLRLGMNTSSFVFRCVGWVTVETTDGSYIQERMATNKVTVVHTLASPAEDYRELPLLGESARCMRHCRCERPAKGIRDSGSGIPMCTHRYPEVAAHVMRVTETARWLEWQDWADPVLQKQYEMNDGSLHIPDVPGVGLDRNEEVVAANQANL